MISLRFSINNPFHFVDILRRRGQILVPLFRDEDII